jgi:hypothetical protein
LAEKKLLIHCGSPIMKLPIDLPIDVEELLVESPQITD